MLKKAVKATLTLIVCAAVLFCVSPAVFAAQANAVSIRLGDEKLELSPVLLQEGRTYVPYDELFEALGADEADYDEQAQMITAVLGDTEISIELDDYYISVTTGDVQRWVYTGASPIIDTTGSAIFVPLRYAAQALGYVVSWDEATRCIELMPLAQLIEESNATYTVMDKYLDFMNTFSSKCHSVEGSFQAEIDLLSMMYYYYSDEPIEVDPLSVSGTVSGLIDPVGEEMSLNLTTNVSEFMDSYTSLYEEELTEEDKALLEQLDDVDISLIVNNEDGMLYVKSPLFAAIADVTDDTWIAYDTEEALSLSDISMMSVLATDTVSEGATFEEYVAQMLQSVLLYDDGGETAEMLVELNSMYSDEAMVIDGDDYVLTMISSDYSYGYEDSYTYELRFSFDGDEFTGVTMQIVNTTSYSDWEDSLYESVFELSYSFSADGLAEMSINGSEDGVTYLSFDMSFSFTETDEQPARQPDDGSTVITADELYMLEYEEDYVYDF